MLAFAFLFVTIIGLALLSIFGRRWERIAVACFAAYLIAVPLVENITIVHWRLGVAIVEVLLFLALWGLAERASRWWLTAAAGFQIITLSTFIIPWIAPHNLLWSGVIFRMCAWALITLTFFVGAWESWADRRFKQEMAAAS